MMMLMNRRYGIFLLAVAMMFFAGCASYETKVVPFKLPAGYPNATEVSGAMIASQAYGDQKEAETVFGFDMIGAGILPVRVIFDNKGSHPLDIVAGQTFLVDEENNLWPILEEKLAYDRIQKKTELSKVAPEGLKYGGLAGIAGGIIGAAIGIVSGQSVADAAMRGAALGAAAGLTMGGAKGLSDTDVQTKIRADLDKRSLENRAVRPGEFAHGFIFFPGEAKKPVELRLQIREADTGRLQNLNMKLLQETKKTPDEK
jgi:hypothetical protein